MADVRTVRLTVRIDVRKLKSGVVDVNDLNELAGQGIPPKIGLESWRPSQFFKFMKLVPVGARLGPVPAVLMFQVEML